jgi:PPE-repeat protein
MDMNVDVDPDWGTPPGASDRGAGTLGFTGTARRAAAAGAAGLTTLDDDGFGGGPRMPMLPRSWDLNAESNDVASRHIQDGDRN